jgi:hypothetical protein
LKKKNKNDPVARKKIDMEEKERKEKKKNNGGVGDTLELQ